MSMKICRKCGRKTNTVFCDWLNSIDDKADKCYLAYVDGEWVEGCAFKKLGVNVRRAMRGKIQMLNKSER